MQLVVTDVPTSARWYCEVLGLVQFVAGEIPGGGSYAGLKHPKASFVIGLQDGGTKGQVAMIDHVSFGVGSTAELERWRIELLGRGFPVSDIFEEEASFNA
ncbi:MAG: VOC family protein, partial [Isosphaeraceae bacterium]|nr:VOC family protein [Isosphaeraceae bacterium]